MKNIAFTIIMTVILVIVIGLFSNANGRLDKIKKYKIHYTEKANMGRSDLKAYIGIYPNGGSLLIYIKETKNDKIYYLLHSKLFDIILMKKSNSLTLIKFKMRLQKFKEI